MPKYTINVNGSDHKVEAEADMPLLWALRDSLGLIGTKFGCGIAQCGACTVHLNGAPIRACSFPIGSVGKQAVRTIEGMAGEQGLHALQEAWIEQDVAQCGYCQAGQIMSAAALLSRNANPTDDEINVAMAGNYCRCGTYNRIRSAIKSAAGDMQAQWVNAAEEVQS